MVRVAAALVFALSLAGGGAYAATQADVSGKMLFVKPVALRGTLGGDKIHVNLRINADFEDGIERDYVHVVRPDLILLAGEIEGEEFFLEESVNGTDVSGQWEGKMAGDVISGKWQSADGKVSKPFLIRIVRPATKPSKQ